MLANNNIKKDVGQFSWSTGSPKPTPQNQKPTPVDVSAQLYRVFRILAICRP